MARHSGSGGSPLLGGYIEITDSRSRKDFTRLIRFRCFGPRLYLKHDWLDHNRMYGQTLRLRNYDIGASCKIRYSCPNETWVEEFKPNVPDISYSQMRLIQRQW